MLYKVLLVATLAWGTVNADLHSRSLNQAPLVSFHDNQDTIIPHSYMVVLKKNLAEHELLHHFNQVSRFVEFANLEQGQEENELTHLYRVGGLKGYAARLRPDILEYIRGSDDVDYVEHDSIVSINEVERGAPWGLARVSSRKPLSLVNYDKYYYDPSAGEGVTVYVVDTGINVNHNDFEGRAVWGSTVPRGDVDQDGNGHGTHVAGTIAGKKYGVAKKAKLVAVKVLRSNGSGSMSDVVKGVEFTVEAHQREVAQAKRDGKKHGGSVANMSLGGGQSRTLDMAVNAAVDAGVLYAVAAGNDNRDACQFSPAASENAITVGASTIWDERASFSNFGKCVDVYAPGLNIKSTWIGSNDATNTISGTSMATPHVAGLAAYVLSVHGQQYGIRASLSPKDIKQLIISTATKDVLSRLTPQCPNLLIYNSPPASDRQSTSPLKMAGAFSEEAMESRLRDPLARLGNDLLDFVKSVLAPQ
ncbi:proteinase B [Dispira simplex]|nr:proteinase B [Dispira simplex]